MTSGASFAAISPACAIVRALRGNSAIAPRANGSCGCQNLGAEMAAPSYAGCAAWSEEHANQGVPYDRVRHPGSKGVRASDASTGARFP